jgi:hypothetical protein
MKTYLIQRGKFENRDYKKGIDSIICLDYMGSSEFEFGALPESLNKIRKDINDYIYIDILLNKKDVSVFCKKSQENELYEYLENLAKNNFHLQEYSDFNNFIYPTKYSKSSTDFWWDIENNLMFWIKNTEFQTKFKNLING